MYPSRKPAELFICSRSSWRKFSNSRPGEWHLIDASGRRYDIDHWERIAPFGGIETLFDRLIGRIFCAPILTNERQLSLDEFKQTLEAAAWERFQYYDPEFNYTFGDIQDALPKTNSYDEAMHALPKLM